MIKQFKWTEQQAWLTWNWDTETKQAWWSYDQNGGAKHATSGYSLQHVMRKSWEWIPVQDDPGWDVSEGL